MGTTNAHNVIDHYISDSDLECEKLHKVKEEVQMSTTETDYYINLFKNPAAIESGQHDLSSIYSKARTSLKACMKELQLVE